MGLSVPVSQKAIMADAAKPQRQDVEQKSADKLHSADGSLLPFILFSIFKPIRSLLLDRILESFPCLSHQVLVIPVKYAPCRSFFLKRP